jgi:hypothetical protein
MTGQRHSQVDSLNDRIEISVKGNGQLIKQIMIVDHSFCIHCSLKISRLLLAFHHRRRFPRALIFSNPSSLSRRLLRSTIPFTLPNIHDSTPAPGPDQIDVDPDTCEHEIKSFEGDPTSGSTSTWETHSEALCRATLTMDWRILGSRFRWSNGFGQ